MTEQSCVPVERETRVKARQTQNLVLTLSESPAQIVVENVSGRTIPSLREDRNRTYLYTRLIQPVLAGLIVPENKRARVLAERIYQVFRKKQLYDINPEEHERNYRELLRLTGIASIDEGVL